MPQQGDWFDQQDAQAGGDWFDQQDIVGTPGGGFQGAIREARQGGGIPSAPAPYSLGGFLGNTVSSAGRFVSDTAQGIGSLVKGAYNLASDPMNAPGKIMSGIQSIPDVAEGLGQYASQRYGSPSAILNTLYEDPVGALGDISSVTGLGSAATAARAPAIASKLSKVSKVTNPLTYPSRGAVSATKAVGRKIGDQTSLRGAGARNEQFIDKTLNPQGINVSQPGRIGQELQQEFRTAEATKFNQLDTEYTQHLGTKGSRTPLYEARGLPVRGQGGKMQKGPTFGELHEQRSQLLKEGRKTFDPQMKANLRAQQADALRKMEDAAKHKGLTTEAQAYFSTSREYSKASRLFENRFVNQIMNNKTGEALVGAFERGNFSTYSPSLSKSHKAGAAKAPLTNKQLFTQLEGIVGTPAMDKLRAAVGSRIKEKIIDAGKVNGDKLETILDTLKNNGIADEMLPNHQLLREISTVLKAEKEATQIRQHLPSIIGGAGVVGSIVGGGTVAPLAMGWALNRLLTKHALAPRDIERLVKQLRRSNVPQAHSLADKLAKGGLAITQGRRAYEETAEEPLNTGSGIRITGLEIPEPPVR